MKHMNFASFGTCVVFGSLLTLKLDSAPLVDTSKNPFKERLVETLAKQFDDDPKIKIYFTGNMNAKTEPCGCAEMPKGGLERKYNFFEKNGFFSNEIPENTVLLDYGSMFFKSKYLQPDANKATQHAKQLAKATHYFPYSALNFGLFDRNVSTKQLFEVMSAAKFPLLSTNFTPPEAFQAFVRKRVPIKLKNANLMVYGLSYDDSGYAKREAWTYKDFATALSDELKVLPTDFLPVVLSDLTQKEIRSLDSTIKRPILFLGSSKLEASIKPTEAGKILQIQTAYEGRNVGYVELNPSFSKAGWFSPADAKHFAKIWDETVEKLKNLESSKSTTPAKDQKIKGLEAKLQRLAELRPQESDLLFKYKNIELTVDYAGKNKLSKFELK